MKTEERNIEESGNPDNLINSIKDESEKIIIQIQVETKNKLKEIENKHNELIKKFQEKNNKITDELIKDEILKMKNRAEIGKRKLKLNIINEFITLLINKSVAEFINNKNDLYEKFMEHNIEKNLSYIKGKKIIHLSPDDIELVKNKLEGFKKNVNYTGEIIISEDKKNSTGGITIEDIENKLSYNSTIERITYRKMDAIKRSALSLLNKNRQDENY
jgi:flagellar biosynthesis/type III secretory pathway protein FliH